MRADSRLSLCAVALLGALSACQGEELLLGSDALPPTAADQGGASVAAGADAEARGDGAAPALEPRPDAGEAQLTYSEPRVIDALSGPDTGDDDPSLTQDETEICFNSKRDGGQGREDIWCATRQAGADWTAPQPMAALNSDERETGIALAADGLALWFSSDRDGGSGGLDVYRSQRLTRSGEWSLPERVPELSSEGDDLVSSVADGEALILLAWRASDDDDYDVFVAERSLPSQAWGAPRRLDAVATDDEESDGFLVTGGRELVFTRDEDLMLARRADPSAAFDAGQPLDSLNSDADDRDAWASPDLRHVVFSSDRDGDSYRLYEAFR